MVQIPTALTLLEADASLSESPESTPDTLFGRVFSFPNPVNEWSARLVAGMIVLLTIAYLITGSGLLLAFIAAGFVARVLTGPTLSPVGQLSTRVLTPLVERVTGTEGPKVAGQPKRFAQAIGATLSLTAAAFHFGGLTPVAVVLVAMVTAAATLESVFGYCLGCTIFARLMARGVIPEDVCIECADISARLAA